MQLIYHNINTTNQISKFDKALLQVASNAPTLKLVSPYIGLSYLIRITEEALDWYLLSDIEAWLQSGNRKHRVRCWEFIIDNINRIRHIPNLHAKVAIGNDLLFLGSANFTNFGIQNRTELSVLINDLSLVNESINWFDSLWKIALPPTISEGDALVKILNESQWKSPLNKVKLSSNISKIHAALSDKKRLINGFDVAKIVAEANLNEAQVFQNLNIDFEIISQLYASRKKVFTFQDILNLLREKHRKVSTKQVYAFITKQTVNTIPNGFDTEGYDRYEFINNTFVLWDQYNLKNIHSLESILKFVIESFDIVLMKNIPADNDWLSHGVSTHKILPLMDLFLSCNLLIGFDKAGDVEQYILNPDFEWPRRWNKFFNSRKKFNEKITKTSVNEKIIQIKNDEDDQYFDTENQTEISPYTNLDPIYIKLTIKHQIVEEASKRRITPNKLASEQDEFLITFLKDIEYKNTITSEDLKKLNEGLEKNRFPKRIKKEFSDSTNGAFSKKSKNKYIISQKWDYLIILNFHKKCLEKWELMRKQKTFVRGDLPKY